MAATILAGAAGTSACDYPVAGDIGRYRHCLGDGAKKAAVANCQNVLGSTLLDARHQSCLRRPLCNARSSR